MTETSHGDTDGAAARPNRHWSLLTVRTVFTVVPTFSPGAPKRNVVVGLSYLLVLWVVSARLLFLM